MAITLVITASGGNTCVLVCTKKLKFLNATREKYRVWRKKWTLLKLMVFKPKLVREKVSLFFFLYFSDFFKLHCLQVYSCVLTSRPFQVWTFNRYHCQVATGILEKKTNSLFKMLKTLKSDVFCSTKRFWAQFFKNKSLVLTGWSFKFTCTHLTLKPIHFSVSLSLSLSACPWFIRCGRGSQGSSKSGVLIVVESERVCILLCDWDLESSLFFYFAWSHFWCVVFFVCACCWPPQPVNLSLSPEKNRTICRLLCAC